MYRLLRNFPGQSNGEVVHLEVAPDLKHVMTCAKDCCVMIWSLKGECIDKLQTKQLTYNMATFSPDGKYLAIASAMSDIRIHRVVYSADGQDGKQKKRDVGEPFDLGNASMSSIEKNHIARLDGHSGSINYLQFTPDGRRIVTASGDGHWKLWDLEVDLRGGFEPKILFTGDVPGVGDTTGKKGFTPHYKKISISPNGKLMVAAFVKDLHFWSLETGTLLDRYTDSHGGVVTSMTWSPGSDKVATNATDNVTRVFNVPV